MNVTSNEKREKARQIKKKKKTKKKKNQCEIKNNCNKTKQKSTLQKREKKGKVRVDKATVMDVRMAPNGQTKN